MFNAFGRLIRQLVPGSSTGGSLFQASDGSGKRSRWEGSCGAEHTVIYLLLQGGHVSAQGLATLSCVSRSFRSACENESLWHLAATTQWPSLNCSDVDQAIQASGGYRRFFRLLFTPRMGDIQLSVPVNQSQQLIEDVTFFIDIAYKDQPVFSRRFEGRSDLPQMQQADSVVFRPADIEVRTVLVDGRPNLSRRALERCARDLHTSCIALRTRDGKFCLLLEGKMSSSGMIGGSVYGSIQSTFALPGIFHVMCLTVDIVVTVTSRVREVERREDEVAAAGAAAAPAAAPGTVAAPAAPPGGPGPRAPDGGAPGPRAPDEGGPGPAPSAPQGPDTAAQRLGGGAAQPQGPEAAPGGGGQAVRRPSPENTAGSAESGVGPAAGAAAAARNLGPPGAVVAGPVGDPRGPGATLYTAVAGPAGGGAAAAAVAGGGGAARATGPSAATNGAGGAPGPGPEAAAGGAGTAAGAGAGVGAAAVPGPAAAGAAPVAGAAPLAGIAPLAGAAAAAAAVNAAAAGAGAAAAGAGAAAAAGAATARPGAPNVETLLDIVLGDLSFQIKVNADQGEGRRNKRDPKWQDLKWK